jgi:hypothetical protein
MDAPPLRLDSLLAISLAVVREVSELRVSSEITLCSCHCLDCYKRVQPDRVVCNSLMIGQGRNLLRRHWLVSCAFIGFVFASGLLAGSASWQQDVEAQSSGIELGALCVDFRTSIVSAPRNPVSTDCPPGYIALTIPDSFSFTLAVNPSTRQVLYSFGTPSPRCFTIQLPDAGVVPFCMSTSTGQMRYTVDAPCGFDFLPMLLVGESVPDAQDDGPYILPVNNSLILAALRVQYHRG